MKIESVITMFHILFAILSQASNSDTQVSTPITILRNRANGDGGPDDLRGRYPIDVDNIPDDEVLSPIYNNVKIRKLDGTVILCSARKVLRGHSSRVNKWVIVK